MGAEIIAFYERAAQQFNGREGETATFLSRCPLNLSLRVGGFTPRHLKRWAFLGYPKRMNIESTKFIVEVSDYSEVNEYLQFGWLLVNHYVQDFGEPGQPSQRTFYVLAWQNSETEPPHPESSSHLRRIRDSERVKESMARFKPLTMN